jgi:hypothetical protein
MGYVSSVGDSAALGLAHGRAGLAAQSRVLAFFGYIRAEANKKGITIF